MQTRKFKMPLLRRRGISLLLFAMITVAGTSATAQSYKNMRIVYINVIAEKHPFIISDEFLARAKRDNYTHIMPLFYPVYGGFDGSTGRYNQGIFNAGGLYDVVKTNMEKIKTYGFQCIPFIDDGRIGWHIFKNSSIQFYNHRHPVDSPNGELTACIAPGEKGLTNAELTVLDFLKVVNEACRAVDYSPAYIHFGAYSETYVSPDSSIFGPGERLLWGGPAFKNASNPAKGDTLSLDQRWLRKHGNRIDSMVFESMKGRLAMMHGLMGSDNRFAATKMIVYGDVFSPYFESSMNYGAHLITGLPALIGNSDKKDSIVFMPWHYPDVYYCDYYSSISPKRAFKTREEFQWFIERNCKIIPGRTICGFDNHNEIPGFLREMRKTVNAIRSLNSPNIIGFAALPFNDSTHRVGQATWNTMEYFAYWTRTASPEPSLTELPAKKDARGRIVIPRLLFGSAEVTQGDYLAATGRLPVFNDSMSGDLTRPAEMVTYYDAILYCNERSKKEGLDTVYRYTARWIDSSNLNWRCDSLSNLSVHRNNKGYFLPTAAEWQYAYRAGTATDTYWGNAGFGDHAWCRENSGSQTHPVRQKSPNAFGLHDMAGNVSEWTQEGKTAGGDFDTDTLTHKPFFYYYSLDEKLLKGGCSRHTGFRIARLAPQ
jgi:formylglycine-generating enzyme required for sulfatase activity